MYTETDNESTADQWWDPETDELDEEEGQVIEYEITSSPNDFNIRTIFDFIESGVVKIPGFQRNYVWDRKRASKLIESIIIGLPIPQIFLYEEDRNSFLVIDGQQRLLSIYFFMKQRFPRRDRRGELREIFSEQGRIPDQILGDDTYFEKFNLKLPERLPSRPNPLNGLNYSTLADYRALFELRVIRNVIIKQNAPKDDDKSSIYEIFNRLNSGGMNLKPQEIRASLYHGDFYLMLHRVNSLDRWRELLGMPTPDIHMKDVEILLRSFSILLYGEQYKASMTKFLNESSKKANLIGEDQIAYLGQLFCAFLNACKKVSQRDFLTGKGRFSISLFEAIFVVSCEKALANKSLDVPFIEPAKIAELRQDPEFSKASQEKTASKKNVDKRTERARAIIV